MDWLTLDSKEKLNQLIEDSFLENLKGVLIFKHSTRCSISTMAKSRLERSWNLSNDALPVYYLDLISYRDISAEIVERFKVPHESPQALLIKKGKCVYNASHSAISSEEIVKAIPA